MNDAEFYRTDFWPDEIGQLSLKILTLALSLSFCLFLALSLFLGLSPDLQSMEQIRRIMRPTDVPDTGVCMTVHIYIIIMWADNLF